jgi:hypothetical protein
MPTTAEDKHNGELSLENIFDDDDDDDAEMMLIDAPHQIKPETNSE